MEETPPLKRLIALILDFLVPFILMYFIPIITHLFGNSLQSIFNLFFLFGILGIQLYYFTKGQTIGKKLVKIKVIKKNKEEKISFFGMLIRETIGKALSGAFFSLGFLWILIDDDNQGWHDKLVSSIVVNEK